MVKQEDKLVSEQKGESSFSILDVSKLNQHLLKCYNFVSFSHDEDKAEVLHSKQTKGRKQYLLHSANSLLHGLDSMNVEYNLLKLLDIFFQCSLIDSVSDYKKYSFMKVIHGMTQKPCSSSLDHFYKSVLLDEDSQTYLVTINVQYLQNSMKVLAKNSCHSDINYTLLENFFKRNVKQIDNNKVSLGFIINNAECNKLKSSVFLVNQTKQCANNFNRKMLTAFNMVRHAFIKKEDMYLRSKKTQSLKSQTDIFKAHIRSIFLFRLNLNK
ncbi:hypothetical protein AB837_00107 [bacterium AB1]|nr:hypothetical protein AB837_00107 [bacterium AB1]